MCLISVIIPTFNRAGPVCRALDSILRQSFSDFEVIVVNDGSTDDTLYWLNGYTDKRLKVVTTQNHGVAHARNTGAKLAQGEWLCFLDSDDVWRKHKLSEQIRYHSSHPDTLISHTEDMWLRQSERVNKPKKYWHRHGDLFYTSLCTCVISSSTVMLKKNLFFSFGGFDEDFEVCEDYDLWIKITKDHTVGFIHKILATKFGGHPDQLSHQFQFMNNYRRKALENILASHQLNDDQKQAIIHEIKNKSTKLKV